MQTEIARRIRPNRYYIISKAPLLNRSVRTVIDKFERQDPLLLPCIADVPSDVSKIIAELTAKNAKAKKKLFRSVLVADFRSRCSAESVQLVRKLA
jgi:hypothetical protein